MVVAAALTCSCESAESRAARENAELEQRIREREQAEEAERTKKRAAAEAAEAAAKADRAAKEAAAKAERDELVAKFAAYTPAGRKEALKGACKDGCGSMAEAIITSAPAAERDALDAIAREASVKAGAKHRSTFADRLDELLLEKRLNPDAVRTSGKDGTTLYISGVFCTRQFMHDFTEGELGKSARAAGFKELKCDGPFDVHTWEL